MGSSKGNRGFGLQVLWFAALACWALVISGIALAEDKGRVARSMFTTKVENREPINRVLVLDNSVSELYFFTDLRHLQGQTVTHRWEYEDKVVMSKSFDVRGPRWRVYTKKELEPQQLGQWTVVVTDERGWPLKAVIFRYVDESADEPNVILPPAGSD